MALKYRITKTDPVTKQREPTGLVYECRTFQDGTEENGDAALDFAKRLQEFYNDGFVYEVSLTS